MEILFPKDEKKPQLAWYWTGSGHAQTRALLIWFWIASLPGGFLLYEYAIFKKMDIWLFLLYWYFTILIFTIWIVLSRYIRRRGSWYLELDTPSVDVDHEAMSAIIGRHVGPSSILSMEDNALIIQTETNKLSLNLGKPEEYIDHWFLHSVKGVKLRLDSGILEPLRQGIIEFLNREIPFDKEEDSFQSEYKVPLPDWFKDGFCIDYLKVSKRKDEEPIGEKISYKIVRNRVGSLLIKCRIADDNIISHGTLTIDKYFKEKEWWMFYIPPHEMENRVLEMDTLTYVRSGPKDISNPLGIFKCVGFTNDKWSKCNCAEGEKPKPGVCGRCNGRKYAAYLPLIKCHSCHGTGICHRCQGKLKYHRSETYWFEVKTGFLIKVELRFSNGDEEITEIEDIEPRIALVRDRA